MNDEERHRFYEPPESFAGTVFDPSDETFGPIMAALQAGRFEDAGVLVATLTSERIPPDYSARARGEFEASARRDDQRRAIAARLANDIYGTDDVEVSEPDDNRGVVAIESVDGGYWVSARVWVDADAVEEAVEHV